jgi:PAS domain S-box-containing protein
MKKSQNNLTDAEILRQKAEEQLKKQQPKVSSLSSENDLRKLAHELQVHQIELEMQYAQLKQAKEEADAATEKYTELYDFAPSGFFTLTKLGEIIGLNLHGASLLGKERLHLINRRFGSSVSDQTKSIFNNFLDKVFTSKGNESCEITLSTYGNLPMYVSLNGIVTENSEQCFVNVMNITDGKQAAELIIANKELAFQNGEKEKHADELIIANKELAFQNGEKEKRADELIIANKELAFQNGEKEKRAAKLVIANIEKAKHAAELILANKELLLAKEKATRAAELILANEAILQSEENFRRSISESPLGIRIVSVDGETIYANKAFLDIYKINSVEELTSIPAINRYTPESYVQHQERKEKRKNGHDVFDYEISIILKNEEIRHVKISRKEVLWNGNKHYQVINLDITEQKKLTLDLIAAKQKAEESDRLKTAFLQNISHEVRTPLNAIVGFSQLIAEPNLSTEQLEDFSQMISTSSDKLIGIITDVIEMSLIQSTQVKVKVTEIDIVLLITDIVTNFTKNAKEKNITLILNQNIPDKEYFILSDSEKLQKIFTHLIDNAIKFTPRGSVEITCEIKQGNLQVSISDTGIGISDEAQKIIFDPFFQLESDLHRNYGGNGLGLSIVKAYIELLNGTVSLKSELNKGTTAVFSIPANKSVIEPTKKVIAETTYFINTILIVDDEYYNYRYLYELLNAINPQIVVLDASNGQQAVDLCRENKAIDIVLMDIRMPIMDGHTAAKLIKAFRPDLPIIAQTVYALEREKEKFNSDFDDYIIKPINSDEFRKKMERYIANK